MNCGGGGGQRDFGKKALFRMMTAKGTRLNADCCKTTCLPFEESKILPCRYPINIHQPFSSSFIGKSSPSLFIFLQVTTSIRWS